MIPQDQNEFDFDTPSDDEGYQLWRKQMTEQKRKIEHRWGIILGRRVKVQISGYDKELEGCIRMSPDSTPRAPQLILGNLHFIPQRIVSITQV